MSLRFDNSDNLCCPDCGIDNLLVGRDTNELYLEFYCTNHNCKRTLAFAKILLSHAIPNNED